MASATAFVSNGLGEEREDPTSIIKMVGEPPLNPYRKTG